MAGLRFHLSFVLAVAAIAAFGFTCADAAPWRSADAPPPRETPIALAGATYLEFDGERYRLVGVVDRAPFEPERAGSVLVRAHELAVYRARGDDDAIYTREAPAAGASLAAGAWYRWLVWPEPSVPVDMRNRT